MRVSQKSIFNFLQYNIQCPYWIIKLYPVLGSGIKLLLGHPHSDFLSSIIISLSSFFYLWRNQEYYGIICNIKKNKVVRV